MLSAADAELVRTDPILPGLGTVLDPEAFVARLRPCFPSLGLEAARLTYLKYRPSSRCVVGYRVQGVEGWEMDVSATSYPSDRRSKLTHSRKCVLGAGPRGVGTLVLEDCASVVNVFPCDRKLPALRLLADGAHRRRLLDELLPNRPEFRHGGIYSLAYKPQRRHVAIVQARDGTRAVIKAYTKSRFPAVKAMATAFCSLGKLRVAALLGQSDVHQLLAFEWLPGRTLEGALSANPPSVDSVAIAGAALAVLHDQNSYRLGARDRQQEEGSLRATAKAIGSLCPDRGEQAEGLAGHLIDCLKGAAPAPQALHGNFQARHVLLIEDAVALLDFDRAARGNPAEDLGHFLADLELLALGGQLSEPEAAARRTALLGGYQTGIRRVPPSWIEIYTAVGLFQLALRPFRLRVPDWPAQAGRILERTAALVRWPAHGIRTRCDAPSQRDTEIDTPKVALT